MKVLVVCHGNICRSPVAAGILSRSLPGAFIRQGGFVNPGRSSPKKIRDWAKGIGIDLSNHRSRLVEDVDVQWADRILYMNASQYHRLIELGLSPAKGVNLGHLVSRKGIPDPNFLPVGSTAFFQAMERLDRAVEKAAVLLREDSDA